MDTRDIIFRKYVGLILCSSFFCHGSEIVCDGLTYSAEGDNRAILTGYDPGVLSKNSPNGVVVIPEYVGEFKTVGIGNRAFMGCDKISYVLCSDSVEWIGDKAFFECQNMIDFEFMHAKTMFQGPHTSRSSLRRIGSSAFCGCRRLSRMILPESLEYIGESAFSKCSHLSCVDFPQSLMHVGILSFEWCDKLDNVCIPKNVNDDVYLAFVYNRSISSFDVSRDNHNYQSIDGALYDKKSRALLIWPRSSASEVVELPDDVTMIAPYAFSQCKNIREVRFCQNIAYIGDGAFAECGITNAVLPVNLRQVEERTFYGCTNLIEVTIPRSVTYIATNAFSYCSSMSKITVQGNNKLLIGVDLPMECKMHVQEIGKGERWR